MLFYILGSFAALSLPLLWLRYQCRDDSFSAVNDNDIEVLRREREEMNEKSGNCTMKVAGGFDRLLNFRDVGKFVNEFLGKK